MAFFHKYDHLLPEDKQVNGALVDRQLAALCPFLVTVQSEVAQELSCIGDEKQELPTFAAASGFEAGGWLRRHRLGRAEGRAPGVGAI